MKPRPAPNAHDGAVQPAAAYTAAGDLAIVTCYFNPSGYTSKLENFALFRDRIVATGLHLAIVECTFGERPRELPLAWGAAHVVAPGVVWQKERLLNLAVAALPPQFTKVAWIDADVLFSDPDWARNTARALDDAVVVQLFETGVLLPRGRTHLDPDDRRFASFAAAYANDPSRLLNGNYIKHGHTGYAWAARRSFLEAHGLYDRCISGSGDHVMAHAYCGDWQSACLIRTFGAGSAMLAHFQAWAERAYPAVRANLGYAPGTVMHVWHGDFKDRLYDRRNQELIRLRFDPDRDVAVAESGALQWSGHAGRLRRWGAGYFRERREDGR